MVYPANGSSEFDGNSSNASYVTLQDFVAWGLVAPLVTLGVIATTGLVMLYNRVFGRVLGDKHENKIPDGPWGFPIVGQSESLPSLFNVTDD